MNKYAALPMALTGTLSNDTAARRVNETATFFTTMLDFSEPGELGIFLDEGAVEGLEKRMAEKGFLEGSEMAGTFNMLRLAATAKVANGATSRRAKSAARSISSIDSKKNKTSSG